MALGPKDPCGPRDPTDGRLRAAAESRSSWSLKARKRCFAPGLRAWSSTPMLD